MLFAIMPSMFSAPTLTIRIVFLAPPQSMSVMPVGIRVTLTLFRTIPGMTLLVVAPTVKLNLPLALLLVVWLTNRIRLTEAGFPSEVMRILIGLVVVLMLLAVVEFVVDLVLVVLLL